MVIKDCKVHKITPVWKAYVKIDDNCLGATHLCPKCELPEGYLFFNTWEDAIENCKKGDKENDNN
jgi:uncharacterized protein (DUF983 family)